MKPRTLIKGAMVTWLGSIAIVALATIPGRTGSPDAAERAFAWVGTAEGIDHLDLRGSTGRYRIVAVPGDSVRVQVRVRPDASRPGSLFARRNPADLSAARLEAVPSDGRLRLEVEAGSRGRRVEEWRIDAPARLAAAIHVGDAEIEVQGIEGGVEAHANAGPGSKPGRIDVDVPSGSVLASLSVGNVSIHTASHDLGDVHASSDVGHTELWIDGHRLERRDPPGSGSSVALDGPGADRIDAKVSVGRAVVRIR